jgi:hypothetical protein
MSFAWIVFLLIALVANLALISAEFFSITVSPSHTADASEHTDVKGPERFSRFSSMFLIQAFLVLVTIGLIGHFLYYARIGVPSYAAIWLIGLIAIAFPLFQVWNTGGTRQNAPSDSVPAKFVSYLAIPVTLLIGLVGTVLFVFDTISVTAFFYPLVLIGLAIVIVGAFSMITGGHAVERATEKADERNIRRAH